MLLKRSLAGSSLLGRDELRKHESKWLSTFWSCQWPTSLEGGKDLVLPPPPPASTPTLWSQTKGFSNLKNLKKNRRTSNKKIMTNGDVGSQNKWMGQIACFWEVPREVRDFITQLSWTLYIIYKTHSALKGVCVGGGPYYAPGPHVRHHCQNRNIYDISLTFFLTTIRTLFNFVLRWKLLYKHFGR